jgi:hypothetical protein
MAGSASPACRRATTSSRPSTTSMHARASGDNPDVLERLSAHAQRLTLAEGERRTSGLRLIRR